MHLLLASDLPNFNLCCLLVKKYLQNSKFTDLSPKSNFRLKRIFKPCLDTLWSLKYHTIVDSLPFDMIKASASYNVFLLSINRLVLTFSTFINIRSPLTILHCKILASLPWFHMNNAIYVNNTIFVKSTPTFNNRTNDFNITVRNLIAEPDIQKLIKKY